MAFNNKNKLNKNLSYDEIKDFFNIHEKSQIESKQWDYYKEILYSLIKRKTQFNIVKLLVEQQHFDNTDLFFHAMNFKNYKVAELLLLYGADVENRSNYLYYKRNIVSYLYYEKLNLNQVSFLFNKTIKDSIKFGKIYDGLYEMDYRSHSDILCQLNNIEIFRKLIFEMKKIEVFNGLIRNNKMKIIQRLLYKDDYNQYFVKRILLIYKNGISLSKTELKNLINDCKSTNKINNNDYYSIFLYAMKYGNLEIVKVLIDYAKKNNIMLNKVYKDLLTETLKSYNLDKIKMILDYAKDYNINYKISQSILFEYIDESLRRGTEPFIFLINYAKENNIILPIHEKDSHGDFLILYTINHINKYYYYYNCNKELILIQVIFEYAKKNNIILRLNDTNNYGNYPLLEATNERYGTNLIQLLFDYSKENKIILSLNEKNFNGDYPLLNAVIKKNINGVKLIMEYAKENNITLQLNETNNDGNYPLLCATNENNSASLIQLFFNYAKENKIILSLNGKNLNGFYPLLNAFCINNQQLIQWLLQYAHEHDIHLEIDQKINLIDKLKLLMKQAREHSVVLTINNDLLWYALKNNYYEFVPLLMDYAKENHMSLNLNKKFENNNYPLLQAVRNNNVELVKLLMNHARENNFILEINDKDLDNQYPLSCATSINNIEIVKLLIDYAKENSIVLNTDLNLGALDTGNMSIVKELIAYTKNDKKAIKSFYSGNYPLICAIKNDDIETVKKLMSYGKANNINLRKLFRNTYPLICAIKNSNLEMVKLLLNTSRKIKHIININDKNIYQIRKNRDETQKKINYPILSAILSNSIEILRLLMDYAERNRILLNLNETNHIDTYPLLSAIENNNTEIVILLMDYARRYNIKLEIKEKNKFHDYPLLLAIEKNNTKIVKLLFSYAKENHIPLEIEDGYFYKSDKCIESFKYPLLCAIEQNNTQVTRMLINYARKHSIPLELNRIHFNTISVEKNKYPLLCAAQQSNADIVKLLIDYANDNNILLKLNEKYTITMEKINNCSYLHNSELFKKSINDIPVKKEYTPLLYAIINDNIDIVKLLIDYAKKTNTTLKIKTDYIKCARKDKAMVDILKSRN